MVVYQIHPLIGIAVVEDGDDMTRYFAEDAELESVGADETAADARSLAGVWSDLDWAEMIEELDRIRHANTPTPPIDAS